MLADIGTERAVLSGIAKFGKNGLMEVDDILSMNTFTDTSNQMLFKCLKDAADKNPKIDIQSLITSSKELNLYDVVAKSKKDLEFINSLFLFPINFENLRGYGKRLAKLELARTAQQKHKDAYDALANLKGSESIDEILGISEKPIFDLLLNSDGKTDEPVLIADGMDEYVQFILNNQIDNVGIPTPWPIYNAAIGGGFRVGGVNMIGARPKCGKAQPLSSIVYTPDGPKTMGDMQVGSVVCTPDGGTANVIAIWNHPNKIVYRVCFEDGTCVRCCADHLWKVKRGRNKDYIVLDTKTIRDEMPDTEFRVPLPSKVSYKYNDNEKIYADAFSNCEFIRHITVENSIKDDIINVARSNGIYTVDSYVSGNLTKIIFNQKKTTKLITAIYEEDEQDCRCISLDSNEQLYITDYFTVTHNSTLAKELIMHVTNKLNIPVLYIDTEMEQRDTFIRTLASSARIPINVIETGKFSKSDLLKGMFLNAYEELKANKLFFYKNVPGKKFEQIMSIIRRWIVKYVGVGNQCLIVYDYFKLMDKGDLTSLKEYEALGYQISDFTNFAKEFNFSTLAFVQLNRQEEISQSDRLRWLCHSFVSFIEKTPEMIGEDGGIQNGNRRMYVHDARFGPKLQPGQHINYLVNGDISQIAELGLKGTANDNEGGNEVV